MGYLQAIITGIPMTLLVTVAGFTLGAIGGIPLALARRSRFAVLRIVARTVIEFLRGIPPIVWIFLIYFGIGTGAITISPLGAAIAAFGVISCAYMAEIYRGGLSAIPAGQWESSAALGMGQRDQLSKVVGDAEDGRQDGGPGEVWPLINPPARLSRPVCPSASRR